MKTHSWCRERTHSEQPVAERTYSGRAAYLQLVKTADLKLVKEKSQPQAKSVRSALTTRVEERVRGAGDANLG